MDEIFGKYADYMALGYSAMALVLGGMAAWIYVRFRQARREMARVEQMARELRSER